MRMIERTVGFDLASIGFVLGGIACSNGIGSKHLSAGRSWLHSRSPGTGRLRCSPVRDPIHCFPAFAPCFVLFIVVGHGCCAKLGPELARRIFPQFGSSLPSQVFPL